MNQLLGQFCKNLFIRNRQISTTCPLLAEPLRKKKRIDPLLLKKRTERKIRKVEREIKRLQKSTKQLKPIVELELPPQVVKELDVRTRKEKLITEETEQLEKNLTCLWTIFRGEQQRAQFLSMRRMVDAQKKALHHLKMHSQELYEAAIAIDNNLIPFKVEDVIKETPPIVDYQPPDGKHTDITKEWKM